MAKPKAKPHVDFEIAIAARIERFANVLSAAVVAHSAAGLQALMVELDELLVAACILERLVFTRNVLNMPQVPRVLIDRLFADNYLVAMLLTEAGFGLDEARMIPLLATRGEMFQLDIAMRSGLSEGITDFLVEIGGSEVAYQLARNTGARLSAAAIATLTARAERDRSLLQALSYRHDLDIRKLDAMLASGLGTSDTRKGRKAKRRVKIFNQQ